MVSGRAEIGLDERRGDAAMGVEASSPALDNDAPDFNGLTTVPGEQVWNSANTRPAARIPNGDATRHLTRVAPMTLDGSAAVAPEPPPLTEWPKPSRDASKGACGSGYAVPADATAPKPDRAARSGSTETLKRRAIPAISLP